MIIIALAEDISILNLSYSYCLFVYTEAKLFSGWALCQEFSLATSAAQSFFSILWLMITTSKEEEEEDDDDEV